MAKVLVVEDEADLQEVLRYNLELAGHEPLIAGTGEAGIALAISERPAIILLDLMLPDISGLDVCKRLMQTNTTQDIPIVVLTARGAEVDRVVGFELGAADYVVKPFSVRELLLRVQAILRRHTRAAQNEAALIEFGCLTIDTGAHRVWVEGQQVELTALEFNLLLTLYRRRNRVQSRGVLLDDVWGVRADIATRTVDTHVKRLREKIGAARDYIETVRGVGYRFVMSPEDSLVSPTSTPAPPMVQQPELG